MEVAIGITDLPMRKFYEESAVRDDEPKAPQSIVYNATIVLIANPEHNQKRLDKYLNHATTLIPHNERHHCGLMHIANHARKSLERVFALDTQLNSITPCVSFICVLRDEKRW